MRSAESEHSCDFALLPALCYKYFYKIGWREKHGGSERNLGHAEAEQSLLKCQLSGNLPESTQAIQAFRGTHFAQPKHKSLLEALSGGHISLGTRH